MSFLNPLPATLSRRIALFTVAGFFTFAGVGHFTNTEFFVAIVPAYLPAPYLLVYVSGVFELLGGVGVLESRTRRFAGYGLLALLVAVFPANIYMAMNPELYPDMPAAGLYGRLPIQFVFAAIIWWGTLSSGSTHSNLDAELNA